MFTLKEFSTKQSTIVLNESKKPAKTQYFSPEVFSALDVDACRFLVACYQ